MEAPARPRLCEVRTTGELFVGSVGGVWAELDVLAGEKKGASADASR